MLVTVQLIDDSVESNILQDKTISKLVSLVSLNNLIEYYVISNWSTFTKNHVY